MKRYVLAVTLAILVSLLSFPGTAQGSNVGFAVGPPYVSVTVPADGTSTVCVYITSGLDGEIVIGTEDLPFQVEPEIINVASADENKKVELTFYGDESVDEGDYSGKLTFLGYLGNNVACGVKIKANVTQVGSALPAAEDNDGSSWWADNYLVVILAVLVAVALVAGIMNRKEKKTRSLIKSS